jgi:hypothetical protein
MIGFNQAENLFVFAKRTQFPQIYSELNRIGIKGLMRWMGPDQQKRLIHYMAGNQPADALQLLSMFPSDKGDL